MSMKKKYLEESRQEEIVNKKRLDFQEKMARKGKTIQADELAAIEARFQKEAEIIRKKEDFDKQQAVYDNAGSGIGKILGGQGGKMSNEEMLALKESFSSLEGSLGALASLADSLREQVEKIASFKSAVDTNLQGSSLGNS